jgi:ADP-ribose pyrophosphatase YjhB (NUDIX family)
MLTTLDFSKFRFKNNILELLLQKRNNKKLPAHGEFTIIGGMVWEHEIEGSDIVDETLEDSVSRILSTKLGIVPSYIEQIPVVGSAKRDSRGWSVTLPHLCLSSADTSNIFDDDNDYMWVNVEDVINNKVKLPFDHNKLVKLSFDALKNKAKYTSILLYLLSENFIVADIVKIFKYFDLNVSKQTISNRWVKSKLIEDTGEFYQGAKGGKPAKLFKLSEKTLSYFEVSVGK